MRLTLLLLFLPLLLFAEEGELNRFVFRFSEKYLTNNFTHVNNLRNFESLKGEADWITVEPGEDNFHFNFIARPPDLLMKRRQDAEFEISFGGSNIEERVIMDGFQAKILCQWDETRDLKFDQVCEGALSRTPTEYDFYHDFGPNMNDKDDFFFDPVYSAFCLELLTKDKLILTVTRSTGYTQSNSVEIIKKNGTKDGSLRLYVTNVLANTRYLCRVSTKPENLTSELTYSLTLKKVRPLVLVHGIRSHPSDSSDKVTTFPGIMEGLPSYEEFEPALPLDFPWNDRRGTLSTYCGGKTMKGTLFAYCQKRCGNWGLKPVILAHSAGGLLVAEQLRSKGFLEMLDGLIFVGCPFFGSDWPYLLKYNGNLFKEKRDEFVRDLVHTSVPNLDLLARGTSKRWNFLTALEKIPDSVRTSFFIGEKNSIFNISALGDKRVNVSSANLKDSFQMKKAQSTTTNQEHSEIKEISFPPTSSYLALFKELQRLINP